MSAREDLVVCPYDPAHMIRRTRMAYHLIKCKEQHPGVNLAICPYNATHQFPVEHEKMHLDSCKDRVIEEVRRYRFNEPIPGWHGDIRNPSHFGSEDIQRYEEAAAFDVRQPAPNARPSRMSLVTRPLPRGGPDDFVADREVAGFMSGNHNDSSLMLAGSLVGGAGNRVGGGGGGGGSGVLGGSGEGGHAPLRRPRVSPTTSLFMRGRSPSAARSESKTGANSLPRTPTPTPHSVSPLVARRQLGVGRGRGAHETAPRPGGPSAQSGLLQRLRDKKNQLPN